MNQLVTMLTDLQNLAKEADEKRLMVFADEFEAAFPEYAEDIRQMMTQPPAEALAYLMEKYPALIVLRFIPSAPLWIETLQKAYAARGLRDEQARQYMRLHPPRAA